MRGINICIFPEFSACISFTGNTFPFIIHLIFLLLAAFSVVSFCPISPPLSSLSPMLLWSVTQKKVAPGNQLDTKKHSFHIFNWFLNLSFRKTLANAQVRYSCAFVMCVCVVRRNKTVTFLSAFSKNNNKIHHYSHSVIS